jgi:hypothetical protein
MIVPDLLANAPMYVQPHTLYSQLEKISLSLSKTSGTVDRTDHRRHRFKRVGPNAMRGRGIGAARGRATIQRGRLHSPLNEVFRLTTHSKCQTWYDKDEPRCSSLGYHRAGLRGRNVDFGVMQNET